jgi:ADP-heptose:LPS heptosyltransferase
VIYHLSLLSFGDNVISLNLLSRLRDTAGMTIVGTAHTRQIADFFPGLNAPILTDFDRVPAFYDVRKHGMLAALRDAARFRRRMAPRVEPGDSLIVEQPGLRSRMLAAFGGARVFEPRRDRNVYEDRRELLQKIFAQAIAVDDAPRLSQSVRRVTINPASRVERKVIPPRIVALLITDLCNRGIDVTLIDPDRRHGALANRVNHYHVETTLTQAVALVTQADLYIGADSLLIHLAYCCRVPSIVLFNETNLYFAPPGVAANRMYLEYVARQSDQQFLASLATVLDRPA